MMLKNIPNALTLIRLMLIAPFLVALHQGEYGHAFCIFLLAGFTDGLDGWLARRFRWQTVFGALFDPLADKLLIATSFISLALLHVLPWWLVILVFSRDLTISFGVLAWYLFIQRKVDFEPSLLSKINTCLQILLITVHLFELSYFKLFPYLDEILILLTTITTSCSYIDYVWTWGKKAFSEAHLAK